MPSIRNGYIANLDGIILIVVGLAYYMWLIYFVDDKWDGFVQQAFKAGVLSAIAERARQLEGA